MINRQKITFQNFLSGLPAEKYVVQELPYEDQLRMAAELIRQAEYVLIGAGAGMSTAAGAMYGGEWFKTNFSEFREKYGEGNPYMQDMYSAGFFPYPSQEAYWGYWSKQALLGGIDLDVTPLHRTLLKMLKDKKLFCLSTNADGQFTRAGLPEDQIFCTQGDYFHIQCAKGCHRKTYSAVKLFRKMDCTRRDCLIPTELVPKCPVCGGRMDMNLRKDNYFVQDEAWYAAEKRFGDFLSGAIRSEERLCLLELGVGFNTPTIIRFPFEHLLSKYPQISLVRLNLNEAMIPEGFDGRAVGINADIGRSLTDLHHRLIHN